MQDLQQLLKRSLRGHSPLLFIFPFPIGEGEGGDGAATTKQGRVRLINVNKRISLPITRWWFIMCASQ